MLCSQGYSHSHLGASEHWLLSTGHVSVLQERTDTDQLSLRHLLTLEASDASPISCPHLKKTPCPWVPCQLMITSEFHNYFNKPNHVKIKWSSPPKSNLAFSHFPISMNGSNCHWISQTKSLGGILEFSLVCHIVNNQVWKWKILGESPKNVHHHNTPVAASFLQEANYEWLLTAHTYRDLLCAKL